MRQKSKKYVEKNLKNAGGKKLKNMLKKEAKMCK